MIWEVGQECFDGSFSLTDSLVAYMKTIDLVTSSKTNAPQTLNLYPNPATDFVTITGKDIVEVKIQSIDGKIANVYTVNTTQNFTINVDSLPNGMYLVQTVSNSGAEEQLKLIVK